MAITDITRSKALAYSSPHDRTAVAGRRRARTIALDGLYRLGADAVGRYFNAKKAIILGYHGFTDRRHVGIQNSQGKHLHIDQFKRELDYLEKYYRVVPLNLLTECCADGRPFPERSAAITIDDGYESTYSIAYPLLKERGLPATLFLVTDFLDRRAFLWPDRIEYALDNTSITTLDITIRDVRFRYLLNDARAKLACDRDLRTRLKLLGPDEQLVIVEQLEQSLNKRLIDSSHVPLIYSPLRWSEVREMCGSGVISVGSHTATHAILTRCSRERVRIELTQSRRRIEEEIGSACRSFCYPNGREDCFNHQVQAQLGEVGYECGITTVLGMNTETADRFALKRLYTDRADFSRFALTVSGVMGLLDTLSRRAKLVWGWTDTRSEMRQMGIPLRRLDQPQDQLVLKVFDEKAPNYAAGYDGESSTAHSFTIRRQRVYELVARSGGTMLDVGCGPGVTVEHFARRGFEIYGVDISPRMIEACVQRFASLPSAHFSVGTIEQLDFPDAFFDVVTCMGVVEYLSHDDRALREMVRVTKPGGVLIITVPNKWSPFAVWQRTVYRGIRVIVRTLLRRGAPPVEIMHQHYSETSYIRALASAGLKTIDVVYYNFRILLFPLDRLMPRLGVRLSRRLEQNCRGLLRRIGTSFIVAAEKARDPVDPPAATRKSV